MRRALALLLLLAGCAPGAAPVAQAPTARPGPAVPDQVWRGTLSCDPIPGVVRTPLVQRFRLDVAGGVARYERTVLRADTGIETDIRERGEGPVGPEGAVTLHGGAAGGQYTYTAEYSGVLPPQGRAARLTGTQHWRFSRNAPADRACQITLRREG